jgi:hypothetical protein
VFIGDALIKRVPLGVRALAAILFISIGAWLLVQAAGLA